MRSVLVLALLVLFELCGLAQKKKSAIDRLGDFYEQYPLEYSLPEVAIKDYRAFVRSFSVEELKRCKFGECLMSDIFYYYIDFIYAFEEEQSAMLKEDIEFLLKKSGLDFKKKGDRFSMKLFAELFQDMIYSLDNANEETFSKTHYETIVKAFTAMGVDFDEPVQSNNAKRFFSLFEILTLNHEYEGTGLQLKDADLIIELLIEHGYDMDRVPPNQEHSAFQDALLDGNDKLVRLMMKKGANISQNHGGINAFNFTIYDRSITDYAFMLEVLRAGFDIETKDHTRDNMNMLMQLSYGSEVKDLYTYDLIINHFLSSGININEQDNFGNTALHHAAGNFDVLMTYYLLKQPDINRNLKNKRGQTPLDLAMMHSKLAKQTGQANPLLQQVITMLQN